MSDPPCIHNRILRHPDLGSLQGLHCRTSGTTQFRNLKYGVVPGRFQDPVLITGSLSQETKGGLSDATKFGPSCPQHESGFKYDLSLVGDAPELEEEFERRKEGRGRGEGEGLEDELGGLNCVVVVPDLEETEGAECKGEGLPVIVWVHGGGFSVGSNSWPQYDLNNFVRTSIEIGKPIIGVSISYRLGPFGHLASTQLNLTGNYSLKDQICAFQWIKQNIRPFGGNPKNITAMGESAGSICLSILLHTTNKEPLFENLILMSGDPTLRRPRDMEWHDDHWRSLIPKLGLENLSPGERKVTLDSMAAEEIVNRIPAFNHWSPNIDGGFLQEGITIGQLQDPGDMRGKPGWLKSVMVGDCRHDATCLHTRLLSLPTQQILTHLFDCLAKTFNPSHNAISSPLTSFSPISQILESYNLPLSSSPLGVDQKKLYNGVLELMSDLRFHLPAVALAKGLGDRARRYEFVQPNPMKGAVFEGYASHELDLAYLLQNLKALKGSELGKKMVEVFIDFAYGEEGVRRGEGDVIVFGPDDDVRVVEKEEYERDSGRDRTRMWEAIGWERWFRLGELLQGCP